MEAKTEAKGEPVLCYVKGAFAHFTTLPLSEQTGDGWGKRPYEHNAGEPYGETLRVAWDGELETPCLSGGRLTLDFGGWSVNQINAGAVPWLRTSTWSSRPFVAIPAGATFGRFCKLIAEGGGTVYLPRERGVAVSPLPNAEPSKAKGARTFVFRKSCDCKAGAGKASFCKVASPEKVLPKRGAEICYMFTVALPPYCYGCEKDWEEVEDGE